ncbi:hypothetical protein LV78_000480 [Actinosynnema pretiosum]|nr:hypothetical protein [Actinosynnema pretiosum]
MPPPRTRPRFPAPTGQHTPPTTPATRRSDPPTLTNHPTRQPSKTPKCHPHAGPYRPTQARTKRTRPRPRTRPRSRTRQLHVLAGCGASEASPQPPTPASLVSVWPGEARARSSRCRRTATADRTVIRRLDECACLKGGQTETRDPDHRRGKPHHQRNSHRPAEPVSLVFGGLPRRRGELFSSSPFTFPSHPQKAPGPTASAPGGGPQPKVVTDRPPPTQATTGNTCTTRHRPNRYAISPRATRPLRRVPTPTSTPPTPTPTNHPLTSTFPQPPPPRSPELTPRSSHPSKFRRWRSVMIWTDTG